MKIGLFYGSTTCYTEIIAEKIQAAMSGEYHVELFNVKTDPLCKINDYQILIFGISTWNYGELQEDWGDIWASLSTIDVKNKIIGLYGLGDQVAYSDWFVDAMGMLHDELLPLSPMFVGYWSTQGYQFISSKALIDEGRLFVGLAIDEDSQYEQTDQRIKQWVQQISAEINAICSQ
ncbi:MAG: flavodoxin FldB [Psychromonas sp.]|nr:flavodoxin FldB [Psychromonas sp.]